MSKCSHDSCVLKKYKNHDECILHCSKQGLDFLKIQCEFYNKLEAYVAKNTNNGFCRIFEVKFPKPDYPIIDKLCKYIKIP